MRDIMWVGASYRKKTRPNGVYYYITRDIDAIACDHHNDAVAVCRQRTRGKYFAEDYRGQMAVFVLAVAVPWSNMNFAKQVPKQRQIINWRK
jgi:hypothetical protein